MRMARVSSFGLVLAAISLGGCASLPAEKGSKTDRVCIDRREIHSISALDDQHALARLNASRYYLLTTDKGCSGLKWARGVAVEGSGSRVCGKGGSFLTFDDPAAGPVRCRVEQIEPVADRSAALDLIVSRSARE